jgi:putative acetyltransferase
MNNGPPQQDAPVAIVPFHPHHAGAFRDLNAAWIKEHFQLEPKDIETLSDPQRSILDKGGAILVAEQGGTVVGCCALVPHGDDGTLELAKMAVSRNCRGHGVGRLLMEHAIARARRAGATRLFLESNTKLSPAIRLYESTGFRRVSFAEPSPYARSNIAMELDLRQSGEV